jgi:endonuclease-8
VPEGDTIHYAASRIRPVLAGHVPEVLRTPHPRFAREGWEDKLAGRTVESVDAHGKNLFLRFEGGWVVHSHLKMTGSWRVFDRGRQWSRSPRRAWLVMSRAGRDVVQFDGPVLRLLHAGRARADPRIATLGPDILAPELDEERILANLRAGDPDRPIGDTLLDQRVLAGIGNLWKVEGCFLAEIDPWRPTRLVADDEVRRVLAETRPRMQLSARDGNQTRHRKIYGRANLPCPRCGPVARIRVRGQWDDNRPTFWCPRCQK